MNIFLFIKQAFSSIRANKLRSFLSTLWIIIWISSFVIMLALWEWAKESILKDFSGSSNILTVQKKYSYSEESFAKNVLTEEISELIKEKIPFVKNSFVFYENGGFNILFWDKRISWDFKWIPFWYLRSKKVEILYWNLFDKKNFDEKEKIAIIWNKLVSETFWEENPIWKKISIWDEFFIIWWILKEKNREFDYSIFIPWETLKYIFGKNVVNKIEVEVFEKEQVDDVEKTLNFFLFKKSFVEKIKDVKYQIRTDKEQLKQMNDIVLKFSLLLWWIWAIALIVWWIWIMNIMLVSVTERTREIWIRKAIWATNWNILTQFLIESIILTLIWSLIAILISFWVIRIIDIFIPDFSPVINSNVLFIAISTSLFMWVVFWLMPAYKAAKLKPIDALHFE